MGDIRVSSREKDELLLECADANAEGLSGVALAFVLLCSFVVLLLFLPRIYLLNNIYYLSRDISKLSEQKELLIEQQKGLDKKLEDIRTKHLLNNLTAS